MFLRKWVHNGDKNMYTCAYPKYIPTLQCRYTCTNTCVGLCAYAYSVTWQIALLVHSYTNGCKNWYTAQSTCWAQSLSGNTSCWWVEQVQVLLVTDWYTYPDLLWQTCYFCPECWICLLICPIVVKTLCIIMELKILSMFSAQNIFSTNLRLGISTCVQA